MDDMDRAQHLTELLTEDALARHNDRSANVASGHSKICLICGDELDLARLQVLPNCCTCVDCQNEIERSVGR